MSSTENNEQGDSLMNYLKKELSDQKDKLKSDDTYYTQFTNINKSKVFQDAKIFNDSNAVTNKPRKCIDLLEQVLYLITVKGEELSPNESTDLFFGVTKLFQSQNKALRRMTYQFIKEMSDVTSPEEIIIVVSCLLKDINHDDDLYRGNSIRVLSKILTEPGHISQINRFILQAVVHKNALVSSSSLVSGLHLIDRVPEIIRRWINEVQEAMRHPNEMVQFHSLLLMYAIKSNDIIGITRLITQLIKTDMKSPLGLLMLIRYSKALVLTPDIDVNIKQELVIFIEKSLQNKSDIVILEAIRAMAAISSYIEVDLSLSIQILQNFLCSIKPPIRFAAVRTLNELSLKHPVEVSRCNSELETLIKDSNKSIGTMAIISLLKTGTESNIDRLLADINGFLSEVTDDNKVLIINAIHDLILKYPKKNNVLLNFLGNLLKENGGYDYKNALFNAMLDVIKVVPDSEDSCYDYLCEFIEDCEFSQLSVQILNFLGDEAYRSKQAHLYIKFIFNRYILESSPVRAAAVAALGKFALKIPSLQDSIIELLSNITNEKNNEVKDRINIILYSLKHNIINKYLYSPKINIPNLYNRLKVFKSNPNAKKVTFDTLPVVDEPVAPSVSVAKKQSLSDPSLPKVSNELSLLHSVKEFAQFGPLLNHSTVVYLTPLETEYVVSLYKYIYKDVVILQFIIKTTLDDQALENVTVSLELSEGDSDWVNLSVIPSNKVTFDEPGVSYIVMKYPQDIESLFPTAVFNAELKYTSRSIDITSGELGEGEDDTYNLDDACILNGDFINKLEITNFGSEWDNFESEITEQFALPSKTIIDSIDYILKLTHMKPCDNTQTVKSNVNTHQLYLSGKTINDEKVLSIAIITLTKEHGIVLKLTTRANDEAICQFIVGCFD